MDIFVLLYLSMVQACLSAILTSQPGKEVLKTCRKEAGPSTVVLKDVKSRLD